MIFDANVDNSYFDVRTSKLGKEMYGFDSHALPPTITIISISYLNITPLKGRRWDVDKGVMSFFS